MSAIDTQAPQNVDYDVVIVGGGIVGSVLSNEPTRLSRDLNMPREVYKARRDSVAASHRLSASA